MIRLFRPPEPAKLAAKKRAWTDRWIRVRADRSRDWATSRAKGLLRDALRPLSFGKCAFCEGILDAQTDAEVEHYVAKSVREDLTFEWSNLFLACRKCNSAKRDADHRGLLLKPDEDDGEAHFWLNKGNGELEPQPGLSDSRHQRAEETIRICRLNRGPLCADRLRHLAIVRESLESVSDEGGDDDPFWLDPETPYKLVIRFQLDSLGLGRLAAHDRRRFEQASRSTK